MSDDLIGRAVEIGDVSYTVEGVWHATPGYVVLVNFPEKNQSIIRPAAVVRRYLELEESCTKS